MYIENGNELIQCHINSCRDLQPLSVELSTSRPSHLEIETCKSSKSNQLSYQPQDHTPLRCFDDIIISPEIIIYSCD